MTGQFSGTDKGNANLTITDGTTTGYGINKITVSAGDLTSASNGEAVIDTSGGGGGGGTISGTIADTQVAYGTANDEIGGDANFTWDSSRQLLEATYSTLANVYEVVADVDITKGQAVYTTGFNGGSGKPQVDLAQADDSATMPAIGIATENILAGQTGLVIIDGQLNGITTSGSPNDILYVSPTVAGAITNVRPTGATELVQNVGNIIKVGAGGKIALTTIGRTNDVPNSFTITGSISADSITLTNPLSVADGGTGAGTEAGARTSLGLGTIATQDSNAVSITGGSITGITDLDIADGGTGASTAVDALRNLGGLPSIATVQPSGSGFTLLPEDSGKIFSMTVGGAGNLVVNCDGDPALFQVGFQCVILLNTTAGGEVQITPFDSGQGTGRVNGSDSTSVNLTTNYQAYTLVIVSQDGGVNNWVAIG